MKNGKFLIILLIAFVSFCFGVSNVKALPPCNIGSNSNNSKGYGYANFTVDNSLMTAENSAWVNICKNSDCGSLADATGGWWAWSEKPRFFYVNYNSGVDTKITKVTYTFYSENAEGKDVAVCQGTPAVDITNNGGMVTGYFHIDSGHLKKITATGEYIDKKNKKQKFSAASFIVRKALGDSESVKNTTKATTKGNETTKKTTLPQASTASNFGEHGNVYSTTDAGAAAGIASASETKLITEVGGDSGLACDTVGELFDEYWPYAMVIIPILLIIMVSIDFFKAMISNDADAIKKAGNNTVKRTIAVVVLLALPALLRMVFNIFGLDFCL